MSKSWFIIPISGTHVQAFMDADRAEALGGEPCDVPADLPERIAQLDGLLELGHTLQDELPVGHWARQQEDDRQEAIDRRCAQLDAMGVA